MYKQRLHVNNQIIFIIQYRNVQYRVPRCPLPSTDLSSTEYRDVAYVQYRDVQVPRYPDTIHPATLIFF